MKTNHFKCLVQWFLMNWYSCTTITQFNFRTFPSSRKSPFVSICRQASLQTSALGSHWPIFFLIDLHFLEIAHNWNYTICRVYVWLLSLRMMTWGLPAWQCLPGVCSFLLSSSVPLCGWATFCLSIHQSVDTLIASAFWLLWICCHEHSYTSVAMTCWIHIFWMHPQKWDCWIIW